MSNEDIMRQAMLAQSMGSQPGFWQSMQAQGWNNPLLNIGMGVLAANKPGASFGQAVGGGALLGLEQYGSAQDRKRKAAVEKLKAEQWKYEVEQARKAAELEAEMKAQLMEQCNGDQACMAMVASGGHSAFLDYQKYRNPQAGIPTGMRQNPDGTWSYDPAYLSGQERLKAAGRNPAAQVNVNNFPALPEKVTDELIQEDITLDRLEGGIDMLIGMVDACPECVGGFADFREGAAGWLGQARDVAPPGVSDLFSMAARGARPKGTMQLPDGSEFEVTPQTFNSQQTLMMNTVKALSGEKGVLSNEDNRRLKAALGNSASSDSETRKNAYMTIKEIIERNRGAVQAWLRGGGVPIPQKASDPAAPMQNMSDEELFQILGGAQ